MRKILGILLIILLAGSVGFFFGMEYKAYQVRTALQEAFQAPTPSPESTANQTPAQTNTTNTNSILEQAKAEGDKIITKKLGDEVTLATMKFKISKATETQTLSGGYGNPKTAPEGSKYLLLTMTVINLTNSSFNLDPSSGFVIVDNKKREFSPLTSIGLVDNYLDERTLQPSIPETGILVYQIPTDATNYSFNILKAGAKELYQVELK